MQNLESVSQTRRPLIVGIGGFSSEVGKTTLLCDLLRAFPGWEAIKTTRGHYRSCGKDPHACCVSDLLDEHAVVRSGRELTYAVGKDTGRYWDAGAANVHWVIATDAQVAEGITRALGHVQTDAVFVEGNSFTQTIVPDFFIMVVHPDKNSIKASARKALSLVSAVYFSGENVPQCQTDLQRLLVTPFNLDPKTPLFSRHSLSALVSKVRETFERKRQTKLFRVAS